MGLRNQLAERMPLSREPIDFELGLGDVAGASFQLAQRDTALNHGIKKLRRMELEKEDSPLIQPDQANEMAPGLPIPFSNPIKLSVLQDIVAENELRTELQRKIALGPNTVFSKITQFGAALLAHAMDPFEFAAGALAGTAIGALGEWMIAGKTAVRSERMVKMGVALTRGDKVSFTRLATEGVAGNLAIEPALYKGTIEDHQDATIFNSAVSVIGGGLGFAAAIKGLSVVPEYISRFGKMAVENHLRAADARVSGGKKTNVREMTKIFVEESHHSGPKADMVEPHLVGKNSGEILDMEHVHNPLNGETINTVSPSDALGEVTKRRWFIPSRLKRPDIDTLNTINTGKDFGRGITLTDNPLIANGVASHSTLNAPGSIHEVKLDGINQITDMDTTHIKNRSGDRTRLKNDLTNIGLSKSEVAHVLKNEPSWMQAWERILALKQAGKLKGVQFVEPLQERFMDLVPGEAVKYETSSTLGIKHQPQNNIHIKRSTIEKLSSKDKVPFTQLEQYDADPIYNKKMTREQYEDLANDYGNKETDRYYDKEVAQAYEKIDLNPLENPKVKEFDELFQENKKIIDDLAKGEELTPDELAMKEHLDTIESTHAKELEISNDAYNCQIGL